MGKAAIFEHNSGQRVKEGIVGIIRLGLIGRSLRIGYIEPSVRVM